MRLVKRITAAAMALTMTAALAGCGSSSRSQTDNTESSSQNEVSSSSASETAVADDTESTGKTLVVYYSATGTTEGVAQTIVDTTGGDLFEIQPVEPYTDDDLDWTNDDSRVSREHDDESLRDVDLVSTSVDNWDSYDTVFIGYPIWWGIAAWPVDNFVKGNDFTGKTVIPFCTSSSSGLGDSGNLLEEMAGTGDWQEGHRFSSGASDADAADWVASLNLNE